MVRADHEAGPFARQELTHRLDLLGRGVLLGDHVVEAEHEQRVGIGEHALVEREREARLVDALEHGTT